MLTAAKPTHCVTVTQDMFELGAVVILLTYLGQESFRELHDYMYLWLAYSNQN